MVNMDVTLFLAIASIHVGAVMTPGANFLTVTQNALTLARRTSVFTVLGVATGSSLYITAGIIGFAAAISHSPLLYNVIRVVGAAYFISMSWQLLTRRPRLAAGQTVMPVSFDVSRQQAYRRGFLSAIANPASALYFLSLFTTFIPASSSLLTKLLAGVMLLLITLTWYTLVVLTFSDDRVRRLYQRLELWINRVFGLVWLLLAVKLLTA